MKEVKFIYWFAFYNEDSPSVRYRARYPLEFFREQHNIKSSLIVPGYRPKKLLLFIKYYLSAFFARKKDSIIVIQRVHSNFIYANLLKLLVTVHKKYTVYDLDDADYLYLAPKLIYSFAKKCSNITAGSRAIANHLSKFNDNIVITSSPTPDLNIVKTKRSAVFTIGWIGDYGGDHKTSLIQLVFPAIKELNFHCKLIIMGIKNPEDEHFILNYFNSNKHIEVEIPPNVDWKNEIHLQQKLVSFDIGIATLLDNEIQKSKSGIKAKQYLNNGVPVLGTKLPENDWIIKDGHNGYFCDTPNGFKKRIVEFYEMEEKIYNRFSKNARESISEFDHHKYYSDFIKIINTSHTINHQ